MSTKLEEKASVYLFFSRLFREVPSSSLLNEIAKKKLLTLAYHFFEEDSPEEISFFEATDLGDRAEEIAIEYTSLFVAPGEYFRPPYESFYCDTLTIDTSTADSPYFRSGCMMEGMRGFIYGSSAKAVEKTYREVGFELDPKFHDLPDHVACELEFVGRLYQKEKVDTAARFIKSNLARWIFQFLDNLEKQERSVFYQKVAMSLKNFIERERYLEVVSHIPE